jgi:imidazolonepropionase
LSAVAAVYDRRIFLWGIGFPRKHFGVANTRDRRIAPIPNKFATVIDRRYNRNVMRRLAVLNASQLVSLAGPNRPRAGTELSDLGIIRNGGMLVRDGRIEAVGPSDEVERNLTALSGQVSEATAGIEVVDAGGRVVLPGFVDAHTHLVFGGNRLSDFERRARGESYEQIARAGGGIWSTVEKTRAASEADLFAAGKRHADWFLGCGTTTVEAKSGYGLTLDDELKILRVLRRLDAETPLQIIPTFLGAHAVPREMSLEKYVHLVTNEMLPRVASEKLAEFCDVFCERAYFDIEQSRRILTAAGNAGFKLRIHADQLTNSGGAKLAAELKATTADHLEKTDQEGIAAMNSAGVQPVLLPGSVYALGSAGYPHARAMIGAGLAVVIATDFNPGSSPTPSMPMVLSLACTQMKMSPAEAITAATINPACSLGRGGTIGSLEPGKLANFSIFDCEDYREVAYWFGIPLLHSVYARGKRIR